MAVGRVSPRLAQLGSASAQSSRRSRPAPSAPSGRCQMGLDASRTPLVSLTSSRGGKPLRTRPCSVSSQIRPLSSAPASHRSPTQFRLTGRPRAVPQRYPAESPLLCLAPSRTATSPRTTARVCRCRGRIVTMPSELRLSAWGRRLIDKPGTRQGAHAPPRLLLASHRVALHH
jgi:hypothetical protein